MTGPGHPAEVASGESVPTELERVVRRWQQLPLDHALSVAPALGALVQEIADEVADATALDRQQVPDLGPGVLVEQLRVMVYDYIETGLSLPSLAVRLAALRRALP